MKIRGKVLNLNVENSPLAHYPHILDDQEACGIFESKFTSELSLLIKNCTINELLKGFSVRKNPLKRFIIRKMMN